MHNFKELNMVKVVKRLIDLSPKELNENLCPHKKTAFNFCLVPSGKCPYQYGGQGHCIIPLLLFLKQDVTIELPEKEVYGNVE